MCVCIVPQNHFYFNVLRYSCPDATSRIMFCIVQVPDVASRAACGILSLPDVTSRDMCPGVHALPASSRARNCIVDAPYNACWAQCVRACLLMMMLSELSMCVFVPDSTFTSTCCNFHVLTPFPRLCVALLMPLMLLPRLRLV